LDAKKEVKKEMKRESGILNHITSLYTKYGIGDLGKAAYEFIDFLDKGKQSIWQILPINPTGFGDSPYQSFSTFAGNTLLICPDMLVDDGLLDRAKDTSWAFEYIFPDRRIDYGKVAEFKNEMFRKAYKNFIDSELDKSPEYLEFLEDADFWLDDYVLFVAIKSHFISTRRFLSQTSPEFKKFKKSHGEYLDSAQIADTFYGASWMSWDDDIRNRDKQTLDKWRESLIDEINYHKFLQFKFFHQFSKLRAYAISRDVEIMGDIPIFVALDSADCWSNPELFQLDSFGNPKAIAGVPPDYFSEDGQLWGNPLYDWEAHKKENYDWWVSRLRWALRCVDSLRIDHFIGFEQYYAIPYGDKTAKNGKWTKGPSHDFLEGIREKLGGLPLFAEDLGVLTPDVEKLRDDFELPGMRVLQFGFDSCRKSPNIPHVFSNHNMVVYTGTHDNNTTMGWYNEANEDIKDYFRRYCNVSGDDAAWDMVRIAYLSIARIAIVPIWDILSLDSSYRMNIPGVASGNWQFRLKADDLRDEYADGLAYLSALADRQKEIISEILEESEKQTEIAATLDISEVAEVVEKEVAAVLNIEIQEISEEVKKEVTAEREIENTETEKDNAKKDKKKKKRNKKQK